MKRLIFILLCLIFLSCQTKQQLKIEDIADIAPDWQGEIIAEVQQSYAGWDVEIGDADNDGKNDILTTGCPDSRLDMFKKLNHHWESKLLTEKLAKNVPGMGLAVKIADLNKDGKNEICLGTGQETGGTAWFYVFEMEGTICVEKIAVQAEQNKSSYTHDLASYDLNSDGIMEVLSAYCGGGEIIRYQFNKDITEVYARKIYQLSGSGEEAIIADVDNDGDNELLVANGFRNEQASVEIFEIDKSGELVVPPRIVIDGYNNKKCFYASLTVGDVNNDGKNELIIGWKQDQKINRATVLGYRVETIAEPIYTFAYEDTALDMAYFEKMMAVADADNDGKKELIVSTRGDNISEKITSRHLGCVFLFKICACDEVQKTLLVDFREEKAESSWPAVGDVDNDGKNEIVLATGKGDRTKPGVSFIVLLKKI
jgi:hypothetical protein